MSQPRVAREIGTLAVGTGPNRLDPAQTERAKVTMQRVMQALLDADPATLPDLVANIVVNFCAVQPEPWAAFDIIGEMAVAGIQAIRNMPAGRA